MFIHHQLGHHFPVAPDVTRQLFCRLADRIPAGSGGPVLFMGFAEHGVGLACGVYQEARPRFRDSLLLLTTRTPVDNRPLLCEFQESHSHATDHLVFQPADPAMPDLVAEAATLVLIDDESTTGDTMFNAVRALAPHCPALQQVVSVTLSDWSTGALATRLHYPVCGDPADRPV